MLSSDLCGIIPAGRVSFAEVIAVRWSRHLILTIVAGLMVLAAVAVAWAAASGFGTRVEAENLPLVVLGGSTMSPGVASTQVMPSTSTNGIPGNGRTVVNQPLRTTPSGGLVGLGGGSADTGTMMTSSGATGSARPGGATTSTGGHGGMTTGTAMSSGGAEPSPGTTTQMGSGHMSGATSTSNRPSMSTTAGTDGTGATASPGTSVQGGSGGSMSGSMGSSMGGGATDTTLH
jgi:hypothetical protein